MSVAAGRLGQLERRQLLAIFMGAVAASLAVMSALHFAGALEGSEPFRPERAGTSEAAICVVLAIGCATLVRRSRHQWAVALAAIGFAIVGFIVGLTFTARGGGVLDIAYHATLLPLLLLSFVFVLRPWRKSRAHRRPDDGEAPRQEPTSR